MVPRLGQEQLPVHEGLVAAVGDGAVDSDNAVLDLAQFAAVLPLHARGLFALFLGARLVHDADGAQVIVGQAVQGPGDVLLEDVAGTAVGPDVVAQELLQGADGRARVQRDRLGRLALQVGQEAAAVDLQQVEGLRVSAAELKLLQVVGERRTQRFDLLWRHGNLRDLARGSGVTPVDRQTDRLQLVAIGPQHADDLWRLHQDEWVATWYAGTWTKQEAAKFAEACGRAWAADGVSKWIAYERSTGNLVGRGGLSRMATKHQPRCRLIACSATRHGTPTPWRSAGPSSPPTGDSALPPKSDAPLWPWPDTSRLPPGSFRSPKGTTSPHGASWRNSA